MYMIGVPALRYLFEHSTGGAFAMLNPPGATAKAGTRAAAASMVLLSSSISLRMVVEENN